jgi:hypothetical protein
LPQTLIGLPPATVLVLNIAVDSVTYPDAVDPCLVGTYSAVAKAGGGFVWDDVLEYRVWCHPEGGSRPTPRHLHFPKEPKEPKHRLP